MLDLLLTITCTSANAIIIKLAEGRIGNRLAMLFINYVVAGATGIVISILTEPGGIGELTTFSRLIGILGGAIFAANFFLYFVAIKKRGVALPSALMRLGAVVPLIVSIAFFQEKPSIFQVAGIIGALAAAVMMSLGVYGGEMSRSKERTSGIMLSLWAIGVLLSFSIPDLINKLFEQLGEPAFKSTFLAIIFSCAAVFVGIVAFKKKIKITRSDIIWGALLGFPNLFASYFLVSALTRLPAYLVFPTTAASSVMVVAIVAVLVFRERLRLVGFIGIALTLISLVAINI